MPDGTDGRHRPRRRHGPRRVRQRRLAAPGARASASPRSRSSRTCTRRGIKDMAAGHHRPRWARRSRSRSSAQAPTPWMILNSFLEHRPRDPLGGAPRRRARRPRSSCAASRSASSPPSCRGTCRSSSSCRSWRPALISGCTIIDQAVAGDAARRVSSWPSGSTKPASRRASCPSSPPGREVGEHLVQPPRRRQGRVHRVDRRGPPHRRDLR